MCSVLKSIVEPFVTAEHLLEMSHGMDSNKNESLNNTVSYFAPKNRVHCSSGSTENRVDLAVGITILGFKVCFLRLFKALSVEVTPAVLHFLEVKDRNRQKSLDKQKLTETKKHRNKIKFEQLKEDERIAKIQRTKRDGVCKSGGHMLDGGFDADDKEEAQPKKKKARGPVICPLCKKKGHKTSKSELCTHNPDHPDFVPVLAAFASGAAAMPVQAEQEL